MATPTKATQTGAVQASEPIAGDAPVVDRIRVSVPDRGLRHDLRAVSIVWRRELIRFRTDRLRAITSLVQPFLFLFILGTGLSNLAGGSLPHTASFDFKTFIYPGVLAMSVLFTAIFSAGSIVWDREFGFLREILVAPVSRAAIVVGKCLGGATIATFQGVIFLCLAWFAHVPYNPVLILSLIGLLLLLSFTLTAFGVMMAARIKQFQAFMALTQMLVLPLFFLSGALYPLTGLPGLADGADEAGPAHLHSRPDAAPGLQPPERAAADRHPPQRSPGAQHHLGWLGRAAVAVPRHRRRDGPRNDSRRHCGVQQDRIIIGTGPSRFATASRARPTARFIRRPA